MFSSERGSERAPLNQAAYPHSTARGPLGFLRWARAHGCHYNESTRLLAGPAGVISASFGVPVVTACPDTYKNSQEPPAGKASCCISWIPGSMAGLGTKAHAQYSGGKKRELGIVK